MKKMILTVAMLLTAAGMQAMSGLSYSGLSKEQMDQRNRSFDAQPIQVQGLSSGLPAHIHAPKGTTVQVDAVKANPHNH